MKVVIDDKIPYIKGKPEALGFKAVYLPGGEINATDVEDADALIVRTRTRCNRSLLEGSRVKFVVTATIGYDHLDTQYLDQAGIAWTNCPGCNASSVGQYFRNSMIVLAQKGIIGLDSCKVGIVGFGHVGREVAKACKEIGCTFVANDPPLQAEGTVKGLVDIAQICEDCDVITFHVPLTTDGPYPTFHLADAKFFASLRRRPVVVNASRGAVADNNAWVEALENGSIRAAVVDTWENEPQIDRRLLHLATIATPHIAGYSADGKANATRMSLAALCKFFGIEPTFSVEPPALPQSLSQSGNAFERALQLYNPLRDSEALKANPEKFEWLRGNYPLRRETWL